MSTIGNAVSIQFDDFGVEVQSKVDTGATTSSLHAEDIKIVTQGNSKVVQFRCPPLSDNICYLPLAGQNEIKSASGTQVRPVVFLNITIEDKTLENCEFNLTDRGNMEAAVLLGQNVLQAGDFTIEVNKDSSSPDSPDDRMNENEDDAPKPADITGPDVTAEDIKKFLDDVDGDCFVTLTKGNQTITLTYENLCDIIKKPKDKEPENDESKQ